MDPQTMTIQELYNEVEGLITDRSIHGRGRTPEAAHYRSIVNPQIRRLQRELNKRGWPGRKPWWLVKAERQAADIADLHDTQAAARGAS